MSPVEFFTAVIAHVDSLTPPHVAVDSKAPPYDPGKGFQPYVIIWPTPGTALNEHTVSGHIGQDGTDLSFQVTTAAPDVMTLLRVTTDVTNALTDARIGGRLVHPDVIVNRAVTPLTDESLRPVRHYMATTWQTQLKRITNA